MSSVGREFNDAPRGKAFTRAEVQEFENWPIEREPTRFEREEETCLPGPSVQILLFVSLSGLLCIPAASEDLHSTPSVEFAVIFEGGAPASSSSSVREALFNPLALAREQVEIPARALVLDRTGEKSSERASRAVELSPGLPLVHFSLAQELYEEGKFTSAFHSGLRGLNVLPHHLEARLWWLGSVGTLVSLVMILSGLISILAIGLTFFRSAAHDLADLVSLRMPSFARAALLSACLLVPFSMGEGFLGLSLAFFAIGVLYGGARHRRMLIFASTCLVIGIFPAMEWSGRALTAIDADLIASSSLATVRGRETPDQLSTLEEAARENDDALAMRSLALHAVRRGDEESARAYLKDLLVKQSEDYMALVILGNLAFNSGRDEESIAFYRRARAQSDFFEANFNLAQAYARTFKIREFESAMARTQRLDSERASDLAGLANPNHVLHPPFGMDLIRKRMWSSADGSPWVLFASSFVAPGWMGEQVWHALGAFLMVFLFASMAKGRYRHSGCCERCGSTICSRCDGSIWSSEVCESCHFLFSRPQAADPILRRQRIQALWLRDRRMGYLAAFLSALIPGYAGLHAKRPDLMGVSLFCFLGSVVFFIFRGGLVPEPLATGEVSRAIFIAVSIGLFFFYVILSGRGFLAARRR